MKQFLLISLVIVLSYQTVEYNTYDEAFAKHLFYLTSASYCSEQHIKNWNCGKPCKELKPITDIQFFINATNENAGYGAYHPETDEIYIVLRGTLPWSLTNWIEDIDFIKTDYPYCPNNCQVHRGFYFSFLGIQDQILNSLKTLTKKYPLAKITITGHSLGGALAYHALVYLTNRGFTISKFYTFGSPRVGDKNFFTYVNQQLFPGPKFRVTHNHDPVPHLPALIQGFHHVNQEAYYKDYLIVIHKKVQLCNDNLKEDDSCSNANLVDLSVSDHANYMGYDMTLELLTQQIKMQQSDPNQSQNWGNTTQTFEVQAPQQQQQPQQQYIPTQQTNTYSYQYQQYGQQQSQQVTYGQPIVSNIYSQPVQVGTPYLQGVIGNNLNIPPSFNANGAPYPTQIICPVCKTQGITNVTTEIGAGTYMVSCLLFLCTGILCCWVPCLMPDCQDKIHTCSSCKAEVGIRQYDIC